MHLSLSAAIGKNVSYFAGSALTNIGELAGAAGGALASRIEQKAAGAGHSVLRRKWRAAVDEDGHYCFTVAL